MLGFPFGWSRCDGEWTAVMSAVAKGEDVEVIQEVGSTLWQNHLPLLHPFKFNESPTTKAIIYITHKCGNSPKTPQPLKKWQTRS